MLKLKQYIQYSAFNNYKKVILTKNLQIVAKILRIACSIREKNKPAQFRTCAGLNKLKAKNYFVLEAV